MTVIEDAESNNSIPTGTIRAVIGLAQGLALYLLFDANQSKVWPSTDGPLFAALLTTSIFVPLTINAALGHLRVLPFIGWPLLATALCATLAYYDITRDPTTVLAESRISPSPQLWFSLALGLFIGHNLLISSAEDSRFIARYPVYFSTSWKYGLQALMAALFAAVFWVLLRLGAELFNLIKIDQPLQIIQKSWFWIPTTTLVLNYALQVTDVRGAIIRGIRVLICNLLSWLLPLMTLIAVAFVAALPFTGLEPLWNTRQASAILLVAAASLIFLINAAYQDGTQVSDNSSDIKPRSRLLQFSMITASAALLVLVTLASYGIYLRVQQYGWTPHRVIATACATVAACHALGYSLAAIGWSGRFSKLEMTNVAAAFVTLGILLALLTPLADPARIAVADQIRRLNEGIVAPDKFDYVFLRFNSGRYGVDALRALVEGTKLPIASQKSAEILKAKTRSEVPRSQLSLDPERVLANIAVVQPPGQFLPKSFLNVEWSNTPRSYLLPPCLWGNAKCDAVFADLDLDGTAEIILLPSPTGASAVFKSTGDNWSYAGNLVNSLCPGTREALTSGKFELTQPAYRDIIVAGRRLSVSLARDCNSSAINKAN